MYIEIYVHHVCIYTYIYIRASYIHIYTYIRIRICICISWWWGFVCQGVRVEHAQRVQDNLMGNNHDTHRTAHTSVAVLRLSERGSIFSAPAYDRLSASHRTARHPTFNPLLSSLRCSFVFFRCLPTTFRTTRLGNTVGYRTRSVT